VPDLHTSDYGWSEEPTHSAPYIDPAIVRLARRHSAQTILDAGCGNGHLACTLAKEGFKVTGVDADPGGISIATQRCPEADFRVWSFESAPPGQFDFVASTEVVEHLYSPHILARFCFEALKPGGVLAMSTPYHGYLKNLALSVAGAWDKHHTVHWHGGHIKFFSRATLSQLLENAGFEIIEFQGVGRLPLLWKSMILVARRPG
jgi:2-polyprenyl-3-methyl-5-hydroxy-6-metoxy-1,4-benzoquinol methylase